MNQGHLSDAETLLRKTLEQSPNSPDAHYLLAGVLFRQNRPSESLAEYTLGARFRTPGVDELIGVASDYILMRDYSDADHWLVKATEIEPVSLKAWYLLGRTQYSQNRIQDAERSFLNCLNIDAHDVKAEYNLGLVYENSERLEMATEAYLIAIKWQESATVKDPQPFLDLGMLLRHQGRIDEALPHLLAAQAAGPRNPLTLAELALCYEHLNRYDEAIARLQEAIKLSPDVQALHFFLGRIYRRAGFTDNASSEFAEAARLSGSRSSDDGIPNEDFKP